MTYLLRHWRGLTAFLREPNAPLNNIFAREHSNALFFTENALFYRTLDSELGAFTRP